MPFHYHQWKKPLYHVGYMKAKPWPTSSMEGPLLSCSPCPEEWRQIAKLGPAPVWKVVPHEPFYLVDILGTPDWERKQLLEEACKLGVIKQATLYRVRCDSEDEDKEDRFMIFERKDEAVQETVEGEKPEPFEGWVSLPKLSLYWHGTQKRISPSFVEDAALVYLAEQTTPSPGVWWNETFDPASLSAPRTGIFPSRIRAVTKGRLEIKIK